MLKYANKVVFQYISILVFVVFLGALFFIFSRLYVHSLFESMDKHLLLLQTQSDKIENVGYLLEKINSDILSLSANTQNKAKRKILEDDIQTYVLKIDTHISSLKFILGKEALNEFGVEHGFTKEYLQTLSLVKPMLQKMLNNNDKIMKLLDTRDEFLAKQNHDLRSIALEIRKFNSQIPQETMNIQRVVFKSKSLLDTDIHVFSRLIEEKKDYYFYVQTVLYVGVVLVLLILIKIIASHIMKLYQRIEKRLYIDELTGLGSRYACIKSLEESKNAVIILIDIDKFRSVNELFGIETGNEVLQKLSQLMLEFTKVYKVEVYRVSADEFIFLVEKEQNNIAYFGKIATEFSKYYRLHQPYISTISDSIELEFTFGISEGKDSFAKAEMALEYAKSNNLMYKSYSSDIDITQSLKHNIHWKKEIKQAVEENNFVPFFQPIVDKQGKVVKYEVLARLQKIENEKNIYISPAKFLDIAIKTKYYNYISKMVIFKSLITCKEKNVDLSINIGKKDILNLEFLKELKEKILELNIAKKLTFEIIENEDIRHNQYLKNFLDEFREVGVSFAIDDFGSGFSNFSFILDIAPDFIKIDGSLIKDIDSSKNSYELVKSIVAFSHALGKQVIAEFVHSKAVFEIAASLEVDLFQGYYFSEPKETI